MAAVAENALMAQRGASPRLPRALPEPATIGICALSGRVDEDSLASGIAYLRDLGHRVIVPDETVHTWRYFAGTDEERVAGFHSLLDIPAVDLVLAARGGHRLAPILPRIEWNPGAAVAKASSG